MPEKTAVILALLKTTLVIKAKVIVAQTKRSKNTKTTVGSAWCIMAGVFKYQTQETTIIISITDNKRKIKEVRNQAVQCNQLERPIIFIASLICVSFSTATAFASMKIANTKLIHKMKLAEPLSKVCIGSIAHLGWGNLCIVIFGWDSVTPKCSKIAVDKANWTARNPSVKYSGKME